MGILIEDQNFIVEKAKTKKDGVYCIRGIAYRVRDYCVTHLAKNEEILEEDLKGGLEEDSATITKEEESTVIEEEDKDSHVENKEEPPVDKVEEVQGKVEESEKKPLL